MDSPKRWCSECGETYPCECGFTMVAPAARAQRDGKDKLPAGRFGLLRLLVAVTLSTGGDILYWVAGKVSQSRDDH